MYYAYRFITVLNDIETLFNNNVLPALVLFWVESCSMLSTGVIEGFIWGEFTLSKAGLYLWQGLRDYRYATVILILLEHFFVDSARIKFSIPLFPPGDILRRKFIQGWDCLDYHDHYFAFFVMFYRLKAFYFLLYDHFLMVYFRKAFYLLLGDRF